MKKNKKIIYKNLIDNRYYNPKLENQYNKITKDIIKNLNFSNNIFHSLSSRFQYSFKSQELNTFKKFKKIVIIGMGGSILGSEAIYCFLKKKIKKNLIFLDNINNEKLNKLKIYKDLKKILFIIISKSGSTIETISNTLALGIIKKNSKNIIIISEKDNNPLYLLSKKMNLYHIEHKNYIGGRYSVLSEVGMVPALLMGLNITRFKKNFFISEKLINNKFLKKNSITLANLLKRSRYKNIVLLNYAPNLDKFLYWLQQLIAESLGKKGKGFLPSISLAPKDHHSLLQLYLDGPKDKLFYIFSSENTNDKKIKLKNFDKKLNYLNNKSLSKIKIAQKNAFIQVLKKNKIPFREFEIKDYSEEILGELFSYFILETVIIGKLAKINPFDQPAVEQVKINTKKLLD